MEDFITTLFFMLICLCVILYILYVYYLQKKETFTNKEKTNNDEEDTSSSNNMNEVNGANKANHKTNIKRTQRKKCVWKHPKGLYSFWEAEPMGDYFPISQIYQKGVEEPKESLLLVKSNIGNEDDKPVSFVPILQLTTNTAIWLPRCNPGYSAMGHIVSSKEPSIHTYRCVPKVNTQKTSLEKIVVKNKDFQIWNIQNSPYFAGLNLYNLNEKDEKPRMNIRSLLLNRVNVENSLRYTMTNRYDKISSHKNKITEQNISIWRPRIPEGSPYVCLGDIVRNHLEDPNGKIETILIHKDDTKPPTYYGKNPVVLLEDTEKDRKISIWKPEAPEGYVSLGYIAKVGVDEPSSTSIIGCIPLEMTRSSSSCTSLLKQVWNNQPETNDKMISIWMDEYYLFHVNKGKSSLTCDTITPLYQLDKRTLALKPDPSDKKLTIFLDFTLSETNKVDFTLSRKILGLQTSLANITGENLSRFEYIEQTQQGKTLTFNILPKKINSQGKKTTQLYLTLRKHIETIQLEDKNKGIPVFDEDTKETIGTIQKIYINQ